MSPGPFRLAALLRLREATEDQCALDLARAIAALDQGRADRPGDPPQPRFPARD